MTETRAAYTTNPPLLSPRQLDVLRLAARGLGDKAIAREMGISRQTVKNHMTAIREKLGVTDNRVTMVLEAIRRGLVEVEGITRNGSR